MFDDPALGDLRDPRTRIIVDLLTQLVYLPADVAAALQTAGIEPGGYTLSPARIAWSTAVPDAVMSRLLGDLIAGVTAARPAFGTELKRRFDELMLEETKQRDWYRNDDPYTCSFVGVRKARALIDRRGLREALRNLVEDQYRVLVVHGPPRSGKTHTWYLIEHLSTAGKLTGVNRFVRLTTHHWPGPVSGEDLASSLADRLGLNVALPLSNELDDTRVRKFLDRLVGRYPQDDGVTRWIILDGLDRPEVQDGARDLARGLIRLVEDGEIRGTKLIVTGLDPLGLQTGYTVQVEEIPPIDQDLVAAFLADVAADLGRVLPAGEIEAYLRNILGPEPGRRDLFEVETAAVALVQDRLAGWAPL